MSPTEPDPDPTEVEWQFDALDLRPVERWLAALPTRPPTSDLPTLTVLAKPPRRLVDHYVDTEDWRLGRAGFVLRTRRRGRALEATIKDNRPASEAGLRQRLEVTETVSASGLEGLGSTGPVGRRLAAVVGRRPLRDVLEVRTRREPFSLRAAGSEVAEVALDDTTIVVGVGERPVQLRRVEVEVAAEWVDALTPLVQELRTASGLQPATLSKFEAGLLAAGVAIPGAPDVGSTDVAPASTFGDVAFAVVRKHLTTLLSREPGTRLGDDVEELHDMRVATRRLRAAIEMFEDALPVRAQVLRAELKWLADALGAVRDLDVQLERMDEMVEWAAHWVGGGHDGPLDHLRELLEAEREGARADLLDALDSPRWERLASGLVAMARQGPNRRVQATRAPAAVAVPGLVQSRHRAVVKAARRARRTGIAEDYHRLRIRGKRLRYALEFTNGLYGGGTQGFVKKLTGLQDVLGLMQDAEVASVRLRLLATGSGASDGGGSDAGTTSALPADTVFVMGGVAEHYRRESDELRESMSRRLNVLHGRSWDELVAVMERAQSRAEARVARTEAARAVNRSTPAPAKSAPAPADATPEPSVDVRHDVPGAGATAHDMADMGAGSPPDDAATYNGDAHGGSGVDAAADTDGPAASASTSETASPETEPGDAGVGVTAATTDAGTTVLHPTGGNGLSIPVAARGDSAGATSDVSHSPVARSAPQEAAPATTDGSDPVPG